jgi:spectinomycin phosphotransferase
MREDRGLGVGKIAACLDTWYGLRVSSIAFLPVGHDMGAAVYRVVADDGTPYFLKIRFGPVFEPGLLVPRALLDAGIGNVLAPLRTRASGLWCPLDGYDGYTVVLYPFVRGENAMVAGLSDDQWRAFGAALRAVHDSGLGERFRDQLRVEDFALPSANVVRRLLTLVEGAEFEGQAAARFAAFWRANAERICRTLDLAEELGRSLQTKRFKLVLCHSDIHAANILVGEDGRIWLIDWDGPLVAPPERDLLFVVGSRIARTVTPREEDLFFEGYGPVEIDPAALAYYRYERIVEDLGEFGKSVFEDPHLGEQARQHEAELGIGFFEPGGDLDRAESIPRRRWPSSPT